MPEIIRIQRISDETQRQVKLDAYDKKILFHLSQDGRIAFTTLAKKLKLSRDTLHYRIERLLKKGIILRFIPLIDLTALGYTTFHVFMVLQEGNEERYQTLLHTLSNHPNTKSLMEYTGNWEIEWILVAKSVQAFDSLFDEITTQFKDLIIEKQKMEIIKGYKSEQLPSNIHEESFLEKRKSAKQIKYDGTDIALLKALAKDARQSSYDLGRQIGIAPNTIRYRIKQLQEAGIIRKFSFIVNLGKLDYHWYSVAIKLKTFTKEDERKLKEFVNTHPYIMRVVKVLGPCDLLLNIATESIRDFHKSIKEFQKIFSTIMISYESLIGYQEYVFEHMPEGIR